MDMAKVYKQIVYDLNKESKRFDDSEDVTERQQCLMNYTRAISFLTSVLEGDVPDFYHAPLSNLLAAARVREEVMHREASQPKKMLLENDKKTASAREEKEQLGQGLLETILCEKPNVRWEDIAGLAEAKKSLHEAVVMPLQYPEFFKGNVQPWKGILLYGPPGTGKTFLAKACATECNSTFFAVSSADVMSKYLGESERLIKELFRLAREKAPSIIFIDEIDSLCGTRGEGENESSRRVKTELLVQMSGVGTKCEGVLLLGATNLPWALDPAVRRRFERRVYIPLPDLEARKYLLKYKLKDLDRGLCEKDIFRVADLTQGFSCADLEILLRDAAFEPLNLAQCTDTFRPIRIDGHQKFEPVEPGKQGEFYRGNVYSLPPNSLYLPDITLQDLMKAMERTKPSVSTQDLQRYSEWTAQFGISD